MRTFLLFLLCCCTVLPCAEDDGDGTEYHLPTYGLRLAFDAHADGWYPLHVGDLQTAAAWGRGGTAAAPESRLLITFTDVDPDISLQGFARGMVKAQGGGITVPATVDDQEVLVVQSASKAEGLDRRTYLLAEAQDRRWIYTVEGERGGDREILEALFASSRFSDPEDPGRFIKVDLFDVRLVGPIHAAKSRVVRMGEPRVGVGGDHRIVECRVLDLRFDRIPFRYQVEVVPSRPGRGPGGARDDLLAARKKAHQVEGWVFEEVKATPPVHATAWARGEVETRIENGARVDPAWLRLASVQLEGERTGALLFVVPGSAAEVPRRYARYVDEVIGSIVVAEEPEKAE